MKLILPVVGVRGDVQIFLALAKELQSAGHEVLVATKERFKYVAEMYNIPFYSLGGGDDDGSIELQAVMNAKSVLEGAKIGLGFFFQAVRNQTGTLQELFPKYDAVIGYGSFGQAEADKLGIPFFSVVIDPAMAEKRYTWNLGKNLALFMEKTALHFLMGKENTAFRAEIGAPAQKTVASPKKIILPMSNAIISAENHWTEKNVLTGYWFLQNPTDFSPSEELLTFLAGDEKPLFITFGSAGWSESDNATIIKLISQSLTETGERGLMVIQGAYNKNDVPENLCIVNEVPYNWILDKVSAVIHHCGMGTTAETLRAGLPSIPVPHMIDQFQWAKRLVKAGVSTEALDRKTLTAEKLTMAIKELKSATTLRKKAEEIAKSIAAEAGVTEAVKAIETAL